MKYFCNRNSVLVDEEIPNISEKLFESFKELGCDVIYDRYEDSWEGGINLEYIYVKNENVIHAFTCFELLNIGFDLNNELGEFVEKKANSTQEIIDWILSLAKVEGIELREHILREGKEGRPESIRARLIGGMLRIWCQDKSCPHLCARDSNEYLIRHKKGDEAGNNLIAQAKEETHGVICCRATEYFLPTPEEAERYLEEKCNNIKW